MSVFDPENAAPGFEKGWDDAQAKREAEARAIAEVQPFEQEKQRVNFHVAVNRAIFGNSGQSRNPINVQSRKA